jgi:hypothetical protein
MTAATYKNTQLLIDNQWCDAASGKTCLLYTSDAADDYS